MEAIEFTSKSHDRMIPIPEHYQDWFKKPVKIILLAMEPSPEEKVNPPKPTDSNRFAGTISLTEEPSAFQARQLSPEQQAARQRSLERMKRGYPLGIAGMKREQFYDATTRKGKMSMEKAEEQVNRLYTDLT